MVPDVFQMALGFLLGLIDTAIGMGFGTIGTPLLLIEGFSSLTAVPAVLVSQAIAATTGVFMHRRFKNVKLERSSKDLAIGLRLIGFGVIGTIIAVFVAISIPKLYLTLYIGILVTAMGFIILMKRKIAFSWKKIDLISFISGFNKAISGGGYGPVATTGLVASGHEPKSSVGVTLFSVIIINTTAFVIYLMAHALKDYPLILYLTLGAVLGAFVGPRITTKAIANRYGKMAVGICAIALGIITIVIYLI